MCTQNHPGCTDWLPIFYVMPLDFPDVSCNDTSLTDCIKYHESPERLLYDYYNVIVDLDVVNHLYKN